VGSGGLLFGVGTAAAGGERPTIYVLSLSNQK
jgi:hypothetical protein